MNKDPLTHTQAHKHIHAHKHTQTLPMFFKLL